MPKGKRDFEKDVQELKDYLHNLLRSHKLSKVYTFAINIIDSENLLVEISASAEILNFLEKRTEISFPESQLHSIGKKQNAFHKTEGEAFLLHADAGKIIAQGNFGLSCLSYALTDFFSQHKDFMHSMHAEVERLIQEKMPLLLSPKRTLSTSCQKDGICKILIRLDPVIMSLDGHTQLDLTKKADRVCHDFQPPFETRLRIDSRNDSYVGKLIIIPTITVTGKEPEKMISQIQEKLQQRPDFKYLATKI